MCEIFTTTILRRPFESVKRQRIQGMTPPITYFPDFVSDPDKAFQTLRDELEWERRGEAPRDEYFCSDVAASYIYGRGRGRREYFPRPYHPIITSIRSSLEEKATSTFEVCFLNRYRNQSDQLGWHADDSPEMDDARPIGIVSLGVEREIWFMEQNRSKGGEVFKLKLGHGSLCLMAPGMQDTHFHRIPKASFLCGERISLTFRGLVLV